MGYFKSMPGQSIYGGCLLIGGSMMLYQTINQPEILPAAIAAIGISGGSIKYYFKYKVFKKFLQSKKYEDIRRENILEYSKKNFVRGFIRSSPFIGLSLLFLSDNLIENFPKVSYLNLALGIISMGAASYMFLRDLEDEEMKLLKTYKK
jgi:hypothetical protein